MAFPPTCIHLSWNQLQLESNSVDLCTRTKCHCQADSRRHVSLASPYLIWPQGVGGSWPLPYFLHSALDLKNLVFPHLFQRMLITSPDLKGDLVLRHESLNLVLTLGLITVSLRHPRHSNRRKVNVAYLCPKLALSLKFDVEEIKAV